MHSKSAGICGYDRSRTRLPYFAQQMTSTCACMQDIGGDGKIGAIRSCVVGFRACEPVLCAGFGYYSIYKSRHAGLFIASSVFIGPAVLSSVLSVVLKSRLMARRVAQRRQAALQRLRDVEARRSRSSGRGQGPMRLEMLVQHYVLRHDNQAYEELKGANDRRRYEGYSTMLAIATEACSPCFQGHLELCVH